MRRPNGVQSVPLYFNMLRGNFFFIQRILPNNSHAWKRANSYKVNNAKTQKNARLRICLHFAPILPHGACRESFRACGDWKFRARQAYAKAHSNYFWQVFPALNSGLDVSWQREQESATEFECGSWHTTQLNPLWSPVGVRSSQERAWRSQLGE